MGSLGGRRILVTRDEGPDGPLSALLKSRGAHPVLRPTLQVRPLLSPEERLRMMRERLSGARWLVLTSPRAVELLDEAGAFSVPALSGLSVAVAGVRTSAALKAVGWTAAVVPERAGGEPLLEAILAADDGDSRGRVLFPCSARAGDVLPDGLKAAGYVVERVPLYEPVAPEPDPEWWRALLGADGLDALTFTSPSAVEGLVAAVGPGQTLDAFRRIPAAVQGPTTGAAALGHGWGVVAEADPRTFQGLVRALETLLTQGTGVLE